MTCVRCCAIAPLAFLLAHAGSAHAQPVVVTAVTGQDIDATGTIRWEQIGRVVSDSESVVAFAGLTGPGLLSSGFLMSGPDLSSFSLVARQGTTNPDNGGNTLLGIIPDCMVRGPRAVSSAILQPGLVGIVQGVIVAEQGAAAPGWRVVLRGQQDAPGLTGVRFGTPSSPQINLSGDVLTRVGLTGTGVTPSNALSLWLERNGSLSLVHRQGSQVPTALISEFSSAIVSAAISDRTLAGTTRLSFALSSPQSEAIVIHAFSNGTSLSGLGEVYRAPLSNFGSNRRGGALLSGIAMDYRNGPLSFVVEQKDTGTGQVVGQALLRSIGGATATPILRTGQALDSTLTLVSIAQEAPALFDGTLVVRGTASRFDGPARPGMWILVDGIGPESLVAYEGDAISAEGAPSGATWGAFGLPRLGLWPGNSLAVAFDASMVGPGITSANDRAIFAGNPGNLSMVLREGDVIDLPTGGTGVVSTLIVAGRSLTESITQAGSTNQGVIILGSLTDGRTFLARGPVAQCGSIDFNGDGLFPDDQDLVDYLAVLAGGACSTPTCDSIDFNNDGVFPDDADLIAFLRVLSGGAC